MLARDINGSPPTLCLRSSHVQSRDWGDNAGADIVGTIAVTVILPPIRKTISCEPAAGDLQLKRFHVVTQQREGNSPSLRVDGESVLERANFQHVPARYRRRVRPGTQLILSITVDLRHGRVLPGEA
jgi:hypothetical protein